MKARTVNDGKDEMDYMWNILKTNHNKKSHNNDLILYKGTRQMTGIH